MFQLCKGGSDIAYVPMASLKWKKNGVFFILRISTFMMAVETLAKHMTIKFKFLCRLTKFQNWMGLKKSSHG